MQLEFPVCIVPPGLSLRVIILFLLVKQWSYRTMLEIFNNLRKKIQLAEVEREAPTS